MMILLWDVFEARMYLAIFGALGYMGLVVSKTSFMSQSPFFLYGCGLLPAMILAFLKLSRRHIYLAAGDVAGISVLSPDKDVAVGSVIK